MQQQQQQQELATTGPSVNGNRAPRALVPKVDARCPHFGCFNHQELETIFNSRPEVNEAARKHLRLVQKMTPAGALHVDLAAHLLPDAPAACACGYCKNDLFESPDVLQSVGGCYYCEGALDDDCDDERFEANLCRGCYAAALQRGVCRNCGGILNADKTCPGMGKIKYIL